MQTAVCYHRRSNMMNEKFVLSCESEANLPYAYIDQKNIQILMHNRVEDCSAYYRDYFRSLLSAGDVLHILGGDRASSSEECVMEAIESVRKEFPQRSLIVVDSVSSVAGYKMLVEIAVDLRDCGESTEEAEQWLSSLRPRVHSHFWQSDLSEASLDSAMSEMVKCLDGDYGYSGKCCISHTNAPEQAEVIRICVENTFPNLKGKVQINEIGTHPTPYGASVGVALCYMG